MPGTGRKGGVMFRGKPWLRFVEGEEGGSTTVESSTADSADNEATNDASDDVDWQSKYEAMRKEMRKQEDRAKANKDAADKLKQLEDSQKSEMQKLLDSLQAERQARADAEAKAERAAVAAKFGLSSDDVEFLELASDTEQMQRLAERLGKKQDKTPSQNPADRRERSPKVATLKDGADLWARAKENLI